MSDTALGRSLDEQPLSRKILLLFAAWATLTALPPALAQAPAEYVPTLTYDVASIRENKPSESFTLSLTSPPHAGSFRATSFTVQDLIVMAYGIKHFQVSGAPDWVESTRYDVQAKSDSSVDEALAKLSNRQARLEKQHMLQRLLADRFQLKLHHETKVLPAFALTVMKNGPKLQEAKAGTPTPSGAKDPARPKLPSLYQRRDDKQRGYEFIADGVSMKEVVDMLAGQFGATVVDKTGLLGTYNFTLQYHDTMPDDDTENDAEEDTAWPPLFKAIQQQLGLKLESTKAPVAILVIDHIEKPSEN
jgi:uncharacterized protein (TIGR03435 family)